MLMSRVPDALYWISRYLERAEHTARVIDVRLDLGLDRRGAPPGFDFTRVYSGLRMTMPSPPPSDPASLVDATVFDLSNPESVASCVTAARYNACHVREEISSEMWEELNGLVLQLKRAQTDGVWSAGPHDVLALAIEGRGLTEQRAAELTGLDEPALSRIARGQVTDCSLFLLMRPLASLGKDVRLEWSDASDGEGHIMADAHATPEAA